MFVDTNQINQFIKENQIKNKFIAEKTGLSESKLSLILKGKRRCEINEYCSICMALNVPFNKFVNETKGNEASQEVEDGKRPFKN